VVVLGYRLLAVCLVRPDQPEHVEHVLEVWCIEVNTHPYWAYQAVPGSIEECLRGDGSG
jgi:hypothetical protein